MGTVCRNEHAQSTRERGAAGAADTSLTWEHTGGGYSLTDASGQAAPLDYDAASDTIVLETAGAKRAMARA